MAQEPRPQGTEDGLSLIETIIAMGVLATASLMPLSTMVTATHVDAEIQQRSVALRVALARLEAVLAFPYGDEIESFVQYWNAPTNASFLVPELDGVGEEPGVAAGSIQIDTTDPLRMRIEVAVEWKHRGASRRLSLPTVMTEIVR